MEYMKAVAKDTLSIAANYNLANTLFRQEDYDNAAKTLERVEATAIASPDGASVYYNQGAVAIAQQNWQKAVDAFAKSLLLNPDDLDAKENYIYAKKMLQNQQQNQQNQDQNQDQNNDQNQNQDQNQDQDNKDNQQDQNDQNQDQNDDKDNGDDQKDDQGQDQQNQGQQPQISPQAAQQMLQAIQAKEKETQDKVNKAKAAAMKSRQKEKNW
jgi:tetratricopeptide (TPR) repeat protein